MMLPLVVLLVLVVLVIVWAISIYNGLVTRRNGYKNAFSQIDVQLKRRYDLIPNLVETAKGYLKHERETLEAVVAARNAAVGRGPDGRGAARATRAAMAGLSAGRGRAHRHALTRFLALAEAYPDLEGQPDHGAAHGGAHLHREPDRLRAPGLQRRGHELQQRPGDLPRRAAGRRLPGGASRSRCRPRCEREAVKVSF